MMSNIVKSDTKSVLRTLYVIRTPFGETTVSSHARASSLLHTFSSLKLWQSSLTDQQNNILMQTVASSQSTSLVERSGSSRVGYGFLKADITTHDSIMLLPSLLLRVNSPASGCKVRPLCTNLHLMIYIQRQHCTNVM